MTIRLDCLATPPYLINNPTAAPWVASRFYGQYPPKSDPMSKAVTESPRKRPRQRPIFLASFSAANLPAQQHVRNLLKRSQKVTMVREHRAYFGVRSGIFSSWHFGPKSVEFSSGTSGDGQSRSRYNKIHGDKRE